MESMLRTLIISFANAICWHLSLLVKDRWVGRKMLYVVIGYKDQTKQLMLLLYDIICISTIHALF